MLGSEYALKYSMPHSVVHIVDNSMYAGQLPTVVADDPSLYSTLVVTGAPMGPDNEIISINRSDILNVAYGINNLSPADIKKYGQTLTYASSIIGQNAPVKFMRVTPDDATYAFSCLLVQWRWDGNMMHVRFKTTSDNGNSGLPAGMIHSSFKNVDRLNNALVNGFKKDGIVDTSDNTEWTQRTFMTAIAAGRGKNYNYYNYSINLTNQTRRPANTRYLFSTTDTRSSQVVEQFFASLINENNTLRTDAINSVNVEVGRRVKGSSIIVPKINESAVKELYAEYMTHLKEMIDNEIPPSYGVKEMKFVEDVYKTMTVNIFEPIYGRYIYNGDNDVRLPYYQVDMVDLNIPQLDSTNRIKTFLDDDVQIPAYTANPTDLQSVLDTKTYGIENPDDAYHVGDVFCNAPTSLALSMITSINQYSGSVTAIPITTLYVDDDEQEFKTTDTIKAYAMIKSDALTTARDLYNRKKLVPRAYDDDGKTKYKPDIFVMGLTDTNEVNKLNTFAIVKVEYGETTIDGKTVFTVTKATTWSTPAQLYPRFVYPSDTVTAFALDTQDDGYRYTPGSTVVYIKKPEIGETDTRGTIKVNGYVTAKGEESQKVVRSDKPFVVGQVPKKVTANTDLVGTSYDDLIYQASGTMNVKWKITGGNPTHDSTHNINGYLVNDIVKIVNPDDEGFPNTYFRVTSISGMENQTVTIERFNDSAFRTDGSSIEPGTYATEAGIVYRALTQEPAEWVSTNYYKWNATTCTFDKCTESEPYTQDPPVVWYDKKDANPTYTLLTDENAPADWPTTQEAIATAPSGKYYADDAGAEAVAWSWDDVENKVLPEYAASTFYEKSAEVAVGENLMVAIDATNIMTVTDPANADPVYIQRYNVTGTQGSLFRYQANNTEVPTNYYADSYGVNPNSENGGIPVENGYAGFLDDDISEIEFKWRYSNLLVQAYRGEKDPRITSPTRCPAKYLFDGGTNTVVGQTILPYMKYDPIDIINASTIYTDDEKEAILLDNSLIENITEFVDVDVKQAMYDLTIKRIYDGIPEDKRPIGPGSGLSLHLDAGVTDANTAQLVNQSFNKRFDNPNVSWDIGGYISAVDGISYTYIKRLVDNMFSHMRQYSVNKPFTGKYTNILPSEYSGFFPDIDTTDWELRELLYNSGGNAWIMDINGNLQRQSQRTLYRENGTSDLIQESNMRTLSQLTYLLQNKINSYLLEYNDDGVLATLKDEVDNMFSNWVGNTVQDLEIIFKRDINPTDGGEIVVCYVNVTFRGLILRVPIIVNVQRRTTSE